MKRGEKGGERVNRTAKVGRDMRERGAEIWGKRPVGRSKREEERKRGLIEREIEGGSGGDSAPRQNHQLI